MRDLLITALVAAAVVSCTTIGVVNLLRTRRRQIESAQPPEPPTGAKVHRSDGTVVPVELVYEGVNADGIHQWAAAGVTLWTDDTITVDRMPGHSAISFGTPPGEGCGDD